MTIDISSESQNVFFRCVEDCNEAIMISDLQGKLIYVNPAWERIYGYSKAEAAGSTPRLLHSGHQPDTVYSEMWQAIKDPERGHWKGEIINRAKDGTLVPVLLTITPFRDSKGGVTGYMGIALDITYRKELEAKVVHQDRLASLGLLASGLAHEVGTPLGVVRGRAEFLMMKAPDSTFTKNLDVIIQQIDRISKLIRSLLRIGRSFSDVVIEPVRVQAVASEVVTLVGQNLNEDLAKMELSIPDGMHVMADFGRLEQILLNLVTNGIHAIRKAIQEGRAFNHSLEILAEKRGPKVAISVRDTGCGIPPGNMKKLFHPFFTTKAVGEGTGLGLAIVAQLVREIKGEISIESVVGDGTVVTLLLDAAETGAEKSL